MELKSFAAPGGVLIEENSDLIGAVNSPYLILQPNVGAVLVAAHNQPHPTKRASDHSPKRTNFPESCPVNGLLAVEKPSRQPKRPEQRKNQAKIHPPN